MFRELIMHNMSKLFKSMKAMNFTFFFFFFVQLEFKNNRNFINFTFHEFRRKNLCTIYLTLIFRVNKKCIALKLVGERKKISFIYRTVTSGLLPYISRTVFEKYGRYSSSTIINGARCSF